MISPQSLRNGIKVQGVIKMYSFNIYLWNIFVNILVNIKNLELKKFDIVWDSIKSKAYGEKYSPSLAQFLNLKTWT